MLIPVLEPGEHHVVIRQMKAAGGDRTLRVEQFLRHRRLGDVPDAADATVGDVILLTGGFYLLYRYKETKNNDISSTLHRERRFGQTSHLFHGCVYSEQDLAQDVRIMYDLHRSAGQERHRIHGQLDETVAER